MTWEKNCISVYIYIYIVWIVIVKVRSGYHWLHVLTATPSIESTMVSFPCFSFIQTFISVFFFTLILPVSNLLAF